MIAFLIEIVVILAGLGGVAYIWHSEIGWPHIEVELIEQWVREMDEKNPPQGGSVIAPPQSVSGVFTHEESLEAERVQPIYMETQAHYPE